ncbi:uncharacterized protein LOC110416481 [Herrania umbratica]|uniref:Uncharacterized protein LOC110416481 n=1 Tax=Herrania umbratica TaxID=108875 RepID=A0A6J1AAI0_9ROSI|nr:uncharacterized protein LOC110416481 [Herrania umbratica]
MDTCCPWPRSDAETRPKASLSADVWNANLHLENFGNTYLGGRICSLNATLGFLFIIPYATGDQPSKSGVVVNLDMFIHFVERQYTTTINKHFCLNRTPDFITVKNYAEGTR